jgi:transcription antitermination factor NusG
VAQRLQSRAIEHYLPLYREKVKWTDRTVIAEKPLFPGYVFARFSHDLRVAVISTPGVVRSLGEEEHDMVSITEIEKIRTGLANGLVLRPHSPVSIGTPVRIRGGIFDGLQGVVTELRQQCKVVIALAAVRQCFSIEMDLREIEVLKKDATAVDSVRRFSSFAALTP